MRLSGLMGRVHWEDYYFWIFGCSFDAKILQTFLVLGKMAKVAVGIDLGTTYSCIAAYVDGKVEVLTDSDGNRTMPSVVAFTEEGEEDNGPEVGQTAQENFEVDVGNRVYGKKSCHSNFCNYSSIPIFSAIFGKI